MVAVKQFDAEARMTQMTQLWILLLALLIGLNPLGVVAQDNARESAPTGRLLMFPLLPGQPPDSIPHVMSLSTGILSPVQELAGAAPFWPLPLVYDWRRDIVYYVEQSRCAFGRIELLGPQLGSTKREVLGIDTCFVGESINPSRKPAFTRLSDLYPRDSFLAGREIADDGSVKLQFQHELLGGITHLAVAAQSGNVYCIVTSFYCFPISSVGTRDSIHEVLDTGSAEDFHQPQVQRPLSRLVVIDSAGQVTMSKRLRPVMYVGFDISADGRYCALSEPQDPDAPETSAELLLLDLTNDSILWPEAEEEFGLSCPVFSPDNRMLAAIGVSRDGKRSGVFISSDNGFNKLQLVIEYPDGAPIGLNWSPEGDWLLVSLESPELPDKVRQLDAIDIDSWEIRPVTLPKVGFPGETILMSDYQQFIWIK